MSDERNKTYDQSCIQFLVDGYSGLADPSTETFYVHPSTYSFNWPAVENQLNRLQELGFVRVTTYIRPATGQPDPDVRAINILPPGMQLIRAKVTQQTVTTTTTQIEPIIPDTEVREKRRNFNRTERGNAILNAKADALLSDVRSHIQAIRNEPDKGKFRLHQVWLRYELLWRSEDIPQDLRHEAEDCRDLEYMPRHRKKELRT